MIKINRDNIEDICEKLNNLELSGKEDDEVCEWFLKMMSDFHGQVVKFWEQDYTDEEINIRFFGCIGNIIAATEIVEVTLEDDMLRILYGNRQYGTTTQITNKCLIPLDFAFDRKKYITYWEQEVAKKHVKTLLSEIEDHKLQIKECQEAVILEKKKFMLPN